MQVHRETDRVICAYLVVEYVLYVTVLKITGAASVTTTEQRLVEEWWNSSSDCDTYVACTASCHRGRGVRQTSSSHSLRVRVSKSSSPTCVCSCATTSCSTRVCETAHRRVRWCLRGARASLTGGTCLCTSTGTSRVSTGRRWCSRLTRPRRTSRKWDTSLPRLQSYVLT